MSSYPPTASGLVYVDANHFTIPGDCTALFKERRAILVQAPSGIVTGVYVISAVCSGNITTVTTAGNALPSDLTTVRLGQDPVNAPQSISPLLAAAFM